MAGLPSSWSAQQLAEFLAAVSAPQDSRRAIHLAVERAAETLDAEVAALVRGEKVAVSIGFRSGRAPEEELIAAAASGNGLLDLPGLGACSLAVAGVASAERLLVARQGTDGFAREEIQLLNGMARVLGLTLDSLRLLERERQAQQRLAASERQTRQILETAHDAFVAFDSDGLITDWNPQAEATFGWSREEALGRELAETIIAQAHHEAHRSGLECFLEIGQAPVIGQLLELSAVHRSGREFPVELTISPLQTDDGYSFNAFLRDITGRREVERLKDEFTSVMSHELRTPLTAIRGSLGLLESGVLGALPEKGQRLLEIAVQNSDRLMLLINDILDIGRIDSGRIHMQPERCDAAELIERAMESVQQAATDAEVALISKAEPVALDADPARTIQTLTNLISNAVNFSPAAASVEVSCVLREGEALFEVSDAGEGIPAEKLESIFGRFQQVDASDSRQKGGTGLGLAICRSIVHQQAGRIWAESKVGQGSTFSFVLPAAATTGSALEAAGSEPCPA